MNTWNPQANELFLRAIEYASPEERQRFLDGACDGDAGLRAEVDGLLAAGDQAGSFLEVPVNGEYLAATIQRPIAEQPGTIIGHYKLLEQIGEGGFGVVFMAEQQEPVRRKVALKVLKPGMDTRQVVARFEAERQALALMDHPNIAHVFDGGTTDAGRPYFVMELVRGVPITEFCDQSHMAIRDRLALFVDVCQAVQHAHQKGIIHRDIKPTNVMVTLHDGTPVVKVIDFGIAKAMGQQLTEKTLFTNFAQMIGTPLYMSPEQAAMSGLDIDTRGDVYSLGVMLYELLTGTTPFEIARLSKVGYDEMRRIIREEEPPKPSARMSTVGKATSTACEKRQGDSRKLSRLFRGELDWIVMKALEKDRNGRYETANAFALDVKRYLNDEPVLACPPSTWYRFRKIAKRRKTALLMAACVLIAFSGIAGGGGWLVRDRLARQWDSEAKAAETIKSVEPRLREGQPGDAVLASAALRMEALLESDTLGPEVRQRADQFLRDVRMLDELDDIRFRPAESKDGEMWDWAAAEEQYAASFAAYGLDAPALAPAQASARVRQSAIQEALLGGLDAWLQLRKEQPAPIVMSSQQPDGPDVSLKSSSVRDSARTWLRQVADGADDSTWRRTVREAVLAGNTKRLQAMASEADTLKQSPHVLARLGSVLDGAGLRSEAEAVLRQAQARYPSDFWVNYNLGHLLIFDSPSRPDEAVGYLRAAVAVRPRSAEARSILGLALNLKGDNDRAIAEYQQAIALDPRFAIAHNNLGAALRVKGRLDEAIAEHREALRLKADFPDAHYFLGLALYETQHFEESIAEFSKGLELDPKNVRAWVCRARAYGKINQGDKAFADYNKAFELEPKNGLIRMERDAQQRERLDASLAASRLAVIVAPKSEWACLGLGDALLRRGILNEAEVAFKKAVELDPESAIAHCRLGSALLYQADFEQAVASLRSAIDLDPTLLAARCELANALAQQGRPDDAVAQLRAAMELNPTDPLPCRRLAWLLATGADLNLPDADEAVQLAQKSVELDPRNGLYWLVLGIAQYRAGNWNEAIRDLDKSTELRSGGRDFARFFLAMANWQLGSRAEAREWYESAVQLRENIHLDESQRFHLEAAELLGIDDDAVRATRARLHIRNSRWTDAAREYAGISDLLSIDDRSKWFEYAALLLLASDAEGHRRLCSLMEDRNAVGDSPYELARACAVSGEPVFDTDRVVQWAQQTAALGAEYPWHFHVLGLAYYRDGQFELAVETLQKSLGAGWQNNGTGALNELVLALAHHRLGQTVVARKYFEQAERRIRQIKAAAKPVKMPAPDWLEIQVLLPEAEALLKTPAIETRP